MNPDKGTRPDGPDATPDQATPVFDLFNLPPEETSPPAARPLTKAARFELFNAENPHVLRLLITQCEQAASADNTRFGLRQPWESIRWDIRTRTVRLPGDPKLNDHLVPYYARLIAFLRPDLGELLEFRAAPDADAWIADIRHGRAA